jgi:hypothetical protein
MKRKKGRRAPPKTDASLLEVLPQFGPATGLDIRYADINPRRRQKIRKLLTGCIEPYVRTDEPNALGRFLRETEHNVAIYIDQRNAQQPAFDREKAKKYLRKAANTVHAAQKDLQAIAGWPELSSFLERLSVRRARAWQNAARGRDEPGRSEGGPSNSLLHEIKLIEKAKKERELLQAVQPRHLADVLFQLEPLLIIAIERVAFQSDEDDAARNFTDAMASAWFDATGRLPTCAKKSIRSRGSSPFVELLTVINQKIFKPKMRSPNNFFQYGVKSVSRMKELVRVSRRSHRSTRGTSR